MRKLIQVLIGFILLTLTAQACDNASAPIEIKSPHEKLFSKIFLPLALLHSSFATSFQEVRTPDQVTFKCGENSCDARSQYCEMIKTDVPKIPSTYACKPLPVKCRPNSSNELPSCDCFPKATRCAFCSKIERNSIWYFQRTCVGGGAGNQHGTPSLSQGCGDLPEITVKNVSQ